MQNATNRRNRLQYERGTHKYAKISQVNVKILNGSAEISHVVFSNFKHVLRLKPANNSFLCGDLTKKHYK